jgi:hypothetical protein
MIYYDSEFFGLGIFFRWQGSVLTSSKCAPTLRQRLGAGAVQGSQLLRICNCSRGRMANVRPWLLMLLPLSDRVWPCAVFGAVISAYTHTLWLSPLETAESSCSWILVARADDPLLLSGNHAMVRRSPH